MHLARRSVVGDVSRLYAVKLVHDHDATSVGASELLEEARVGAHVRHPNVVQIVEAGQSDGQVYLAMEYVEGGTLRDLLKRASAADPIPLPVAGRIMADALRGLAAAHRACDDQGRPLHIVHRDFSPQNLLIGCDGVTRLADFGIARAASRRQVTQTGLVKGKLRYMAPEQAHGAPLDGRCDLWAAGAVLWEMLAGCPMLSGDGDAQVLLELISGPEPDPPSLYRRVSPDIDELLAAMLQRDVDQRIASADEALERLHEAWAGDLAQPEVVGALISDVVGSSLEARERELEAATQTLTAVTAASEERNRPRPRVLAGVGLGAGALATLVLLPFDEPSPAMLESSFPGFEVPSVSATATTEPPPVATSFAIRADAVVAQIQVGSDAPLVLPVPGRELQLPASTRGKIVTFFARDGRRIKVRVTGPTELTFPARPTPRFTPSPVPNDDRLAPDP